MLAEPIRLKSSTPRAVSSFAGVGYHLGLANLVGGERVLDLGSGSGMYGAHTIELLAVKPTEISK